MGKSISTAASRVMFAKIKITKAANEIRAREQRDQRLCDPFEQAKQLLQRRGYVVFAQSLIVPKSRLICVGSKTMTRDEVIAFAKERFQ